tara:strand:- start:1812 stop:3095 length:1284 start_codon:yes stop_codon:yes gene_type:complete
MAASGDLPNFSLAGTGKTLSALEAFKVAGHKRGLVLAPNIALQMWQEEAEEWLGCKAQVLRKGADIIDPAADIVICSYDLAAAAQRSYLYKHFDGGALILDEADRLRRFTSKRTCAVYGNRTDGAGGFSEKFDQIWPMTGNPIYRHNDDLWSQLRPLYPDILERYGALSYEEFVRTFCVVAMKKFHANMPPTLTVIRSQNEAIVNHIIYKEIGAIRRLAASDLPDLTTTKLYPKLGVIPAEYGQRVNKMTEMDLIRALVSTDPDDDYAMAHVWQAVALAKVKGAREYIVDCCQQAPVLIGVWHSSVGQAYQDELTKAGLKVHRVYGATSDDDRQRTKDLFNAGDIDVIVGQMQAMGVSWNLQQSSHRVIIAQDHFSPSVIEQFYKRVYRKGQTKHTHLDYLTSDHPLDRVIERLRKARQKSQDTAIG